MQALVYLGETRGEMDFCRRRTLRRRGCGVFLHMHAAVWRPAAANARTQRTGGGGICAEGVIPRLKLQPPSRSPAGGNSVVSFKRRSPPLPFAQSKKLCYYGPIKAKPLDKAMWGNTILNRTDIFLY